MTDEQHSAPGASPPGPGRRAPGDRAGAPGYEGPSAAEGPSWPAGGSRGAGNDGDEPRRTLNRARQHKMVAGVCGGLGRQYDLDPVVFRVPVAVLSVIGGLGLVFYGFAWLIIPAEGERENEATKMLSGRVEGASLSAVLAALVGCGLFLSSYGDGDSPSSFSLVVAGAVAAAAYWSLRRRPARGDEAGGAADQALGHVVADVPPETKAPPSPVLPLWWQGPPLTKDGGTGDAIGSLGAPGDTSGKPDDLPRAHLRRNRRERRSLGGLTFLSAFVATVFAVGMTWAHYPLGASLTAGLGCALVVYGVGTAICSFVGRVGGGTLFAVLLTAALLMGASLLPRNLYARWETPVWTPTSVAQTQQRYEMGLGRGVLDLTSTLPGRRQSLRTEVRMAGGELRVLVPDDLAVRVELEVGMGGYRVEGRTAGSSVVGEVSDGGVGTWAEHRLRPVGDGKPRGTLDLRLTAGMGEVVVVQHERHGRHAEQGAGG